MWHQLNRLLTNRRLKLPGAEEALTLFVHERQLLLSQWAEVRSVLLIMEFQVNC